MSIISRNLRCFAIAAVSAPLLGGCVSEGFDMVDGHVNNAVSFVAAPSGTPLRVPIFVASTRRGEAAADTDGRARFSLIAMGVPPGHRAGAIERPSFGAADPRRHFSLISRSPMEEDEFLGEIASHVSGRVGSSRDILLYIHGFNTSLDEARLRIAQIAADGRFSGVTALFVWNSRGGLFAYEIGQGSRHRRQRRARQAARRSSRTPGVGRIHILAHSMGAWLTMESLRAVAISGHPDLDGRLGEVMLAAPDIDLTVFKRQLARVDPKHVSIFIAGNDRALSISSRIAGNRPRLGAMDPANPSDQAELDRLGVSVHDISSFSTDFVGHGAFAEAPDVVRRIGAQLAAPRADDAETQAVPDFRGSAPAAAAVLAAPPSRAIETQPSLPPAAR